MELSDAVNQNDRLVIWSNRAALATKRPKGMSTWAHCPAATAGTEYSFRGRLTSRIAVTEKGPTPAEPPFSQNRNDVVERSANPSGMSMKMPFQGRGVVAMDRVPSFTGEVAAMSFLPFQMLWLNPLRKASS